MVSRIRLMAAGIAIVTVTGVAVKAFPEVTRHSPRWVVAHLGAAVRDPGRVARAVRRAATKHSSGFVAAAASQTPATPLTNYEFAVRPTHPRVWLDDMRLARLKGFAARNTKRWQQVKSAADAAVGNASAESDALPLLGLAFQVTGNASYCARAVTLLGSKRNRSRRASHAGCAD